MEVVEEFLSVQGEGTLVGTPAYFVRLARCNLRCPWCDTKYSWSPAKPSSPREVGDRFLSSGLPLLVLTGGEPLLWLKDVVELVSYVRSKGYVGLIQIETNGTIYPEGLEPYDVWITVSPKVTCDYYVNDPRTTKRILDNFKGELKLVVRSEDLSCAKRFLDALGEFDAPLILQPLYEGRDYAETSRRLVEAVMKDVELRKRARVIPQIHKLLGVP